MWTLLMIGLGVLIGWQFPQPTFAKKVQDKIVAWTKAKIGYWGG
jgi:hypothetical protein